MFRKLPRTRTRKDRSADSGARDEGGGKSAKTHKRPDFVQPPAGDAGGGGAEGERLAVRNQVRRLPCTVGGLRRRSCACYTRTGHDWTDGSHPSPMRWHELDLRRRSAGRRDRRLRRRGARRFRRAAARPEGRTGRTRLFRLRPPRGATARSLSEHAAARAQAAPAGAAGRGRSRRSDLFHRQLEGDGRSMLDGSAARATRASSPSGPKRPYRSRPRPRLAEDQVRQAAGIRHRRLVAFGQVPAVRLAAARPPRRRASCAMPAGSAPASSQTEMETLRQNLDALSRKTPPVAGDVPHSVARNAHWVAPELVAEIGYAEFTSDGFVRHARYLGLRQDKPRPKSVTRDRPASSGGRK